MEAHYPHRIAIKTPKLFRSISYWWHGTCVLNFLI